MAGRTRKVWANRPNKAIIPRSVPRNSRMAKHSKSQRILTHLQVWTALDRVAEGAGFSPWGLAKRAGLDPTTFNKSKRITGDGRERWPSTESVAKALAATNSSIDTFVQLIGDCARGAQSVPLLGFAQAGNGGYFARNGLSTRELWDETSLPFPHAYVAARLGLSRSPTRAGH